MRKLVIEEIRTISKKIQLEEQSNPDIKHHLFSMALSMDINSNELVIDQLCKVLAKWPVEEPSILDSSAIFSQWP